MKVRGWKKIFHASGNEKKAEVAILESDKMDFKTKTVTLDKAGHYLMIKGSIQGEDMTIISIYLLKIEASQHTKQITDTHKKRN